MPAYDDPLPRGFWVGASLGLGLVVVAAVVGVIGAIVDRDLHSAAYWLMTPFSVLGVLAIPLLSREHQRKRDADSERPKSKT